MEKINFIKITQSASDIKKFLELESKVIGAKTYSGIETEQEAIEEIQNNVCYFIEKDGHIVGSVDYEIKSPAHAYISGLIIDPDFQGQGIGYAALKKLLESDLKNTNRIDLVTHPHNSRAIKVYLSLGFVIESWKDNFYGDGEPRIVMARNQ